MVQECLGCRRRSELDHGGVTVLRPSEEFRKLAAPLAVGPHDQPEGRLRIEQGIAERLTIVAVQALACDDSE